MQGKMLVVVAAFLAVLCGRSSAAEPKRPNVLFLVSDDLTNFHG